MFGKKNWFIVDGYKPNHGKEIEKGYIGHESYMILNIHEHPVEINIDFYFSDASPIKGIKISIPGERVIAFRSSDEKILGFKLDNNRQYSVHIHCDEDIIVQYGRLDITQPNMAFLSTMGYSE